MTAGVYDLMWFDTVDGSVARESGVAVLQGDVTWRKSASVGGEIALYIRRSVSQKRRP